MDKLTAIKIKYEDGTYSDEIPVSVLAGNVEWDSTHTLVDVLGNIDVDATGTIQNQISQLFNEKVDQTQLRNYVTTQLNANVTSWLNQNVNPVGSAVIVDESLSINGAAADAKATGDRIEDLKSQINESVEDSFDKLVILKKPLFYTLNPGYISNTGEITSQDSSKKEVYTNLIPINEGETIQYRFLWGTDDEKWMAIAKYNSEKEFIVRSTIINSSTDRSYESSITQSNNVAYLSFTYRTYGDANFSAFTDWNELDDKIAEVADGISDSIADSIGGKDITSSYQNGYIATNLSTVNLDNTHSTDKNHKYAIIQCSKDDVFTIRGYGGSSIFSVWCWVASDRTTKISSSGSINIEKDTIIRAPEGAAYLVSNVLVSSNYSLVKGVKIINNVNNIETSLRSLNLFADTDAVSGYLTSTGEIVSGSNGEKTSDYIPVKEGDLLNMRIWANPGASYLWACVGTYDENKTFLTRIIYQSAGGDKYIKGLYTVPSGVAFIRYSARFYSDGVAMVSFGDFDIGYIPSYKDIASSKEDTDSYDVLEDISDITGNTIYTNLYEDGYIATNQATIDINNVHSSSVYKHIVISCNSGDIFSIKGHGGSTTIYSLIVFVDENGNKLSGSSLASYDDYHVFKAPNNTAFLISNVNVNYDYGLIKNVLLVNEVKEIKNQSLSGTGLYNPLLRPASTRFVMHRGMSTSAPENTIPSFTLAGQAGTWAIETDVYETTDGYFILSHDRDVSRMTDGTGNITDMTYAQTQECTIDAGSNVDQYPNLKMPQLSEYLKICKRYGCVAFIEIKGVTHYDAFVAEIKKCGMEGSAALLCYYDANVISILRGLTAMPIVLIGALTADLTDLIQKASEYTDIWLTVHSIVTTGELINNAHLNNIPIGPWTVNNATSAETYFSNGADYITSDNLAKIPDN